MDSPRFFYKEALAAAQSGWSVAFVAIGSDSTPRRSAGVLTLPVAPSASRLKFKCSAHALWLAFRVRPRLVHVHDLQSLLVGRLLKLMIGCELVYDATEDFPLVHPINMGLRGAKARVASLVLSGYERLLTRGAGAVVAVDELIAGRFEKWGRYTRVVRNLSRKHVSTLQPPPRLRTLFGGFTFVYLGQMGHQTAGFELLHAHEYLTRRHPEARLLLVGGFADASYETAFRAEMRRLELQESVVLVEAVSYELVSSYLSCATVGLVTYPRDNNYGDRCRWTHKLCDYLAAGLPMLASDFEGLRSVLKPLGCARFAGPSDPGSIADTMAAFIEDPEATRDMADRCRAAYERELNWDVEQLRLLEVYAALLGSPVAVGGEL